MPRAASLLTAVLFSGAMACVSSDPPVVQSTPERWTPITLNEIADNALRQTATDLLSLVDSDQLWPAFMLRSPAVIVQGPTAYCIGRCVPIIRGGSGTSLVWRGAAAVSMVPGQFQFSTSREWGLSGDGEIVVVAFDRRDQTVTVTAHETFHLHYQTEYAHSFGDEMRGDGRSASDATRQKLEEHYSRSVAVELRAECEALADTLRAHDRQTALAALRRFSAIRAERRARHDAPSFEEDFWERQEGVPANLERRIARRRKFADPSVIETALSSSGCAAIPRASYLLLLGGLQSAVLDAIGDPLVWPQRVYPRDGTPASSLYLLIRELSNDSKER